MVDTQGAFYGVFLYIEYPPPWVVDTQGAFCGGKKYPPDCGEMSTLQSLGLCGGPWRVKVVDTQIGGCQPKEAPRDLGRSGELPGRLARDQSSPRRTTPGNTRFVFFSPAPGAQ